MGGYDYSNIETLYEDDFSDGFGNWHHEGIGQIEESPDGGMRLHCFGSKQGGPGCMAFFRPDIPDQMAVEYDLTIRSHGGLVINYIAIRGLNGEDLIGDVDKMEPRIGKMANYFGTRWGLQSYHVSVSRFNDKGEHTGTSNWRRNPGMILVCHGKDLVTEVDRKFHIRISKDKGHLQLYVDGEHSMAFLDRDEGRGPIPDYGKFGFRLIGSDVKADIENFKVFKLEVPDGIWGDNSDAR